jgi:cytidine deaminase
MKKKEMFELVLKARDLAIAPYSNFQVGSIVICKDGTIISGCNIEVSSYGLTMCAERVALFKALSDGQRNFTDIVVIADSPEIVTPCGACRQIMTDFALTANVHLFNTEGKYKKISVKELLPLHFDSTQFKKKKNTK